MGKFLSFVGVTAAAVFSSTFVYLYMTDKEVQDKVNTAVKSVGDAVVEIKNSIEMTKLSRQGQQNPTERNQAWVDEQWDALGI